MKMYIYSPKKQMEKKKKQSISMQEETFSARNAKNSDVIRRIYN